MPPKRNPRLSKRKKEPCSPSGNTAASASGLSSVEPVTPAQIQEPPPYTEEANEQHPIAEPSLNNEARGEEEYDDGETENGRRWRDRMARDRERFLGIARRRAAHFAHFNPDDAESEASAKRSRSSSSNQEQQQPEEDWPGPFSTARKLAEERADAALARKTLVKESNAPLVEWTPSGKPGFEVLTRRAPPSLLHMAVDVLCENMECVESLHGVPDVLRKQLSFKICALRKLDHKILRLFVDGSPSAISIPDCSSVSEEELTKILAQCSIHSTEVIDLRLCGRAFSDQCVTATLSRSFSLSNLSVLCLKGAYRLTDKGLSAIVKSSPRLAYLDISLCSLLTEAAVTLVADCLGESLISLSLECCAQLDGSKLLPSLIRLQKLSKLSLSGVSSISDDVLSELLTHIGVELKQLHIADCVLLSDAAAFSIGACCPGLNVLVLDQLSGLTDVALAQITDGCRSLQRMSLQRCKFSDEAVAAFVTASGSSLREFSVNNVKKAGDQTLLALAKHSFKALELLDASFCRNMSDDALGFLADACSHLHILRLFGCTQVTGKFLNGHSNHLLKVIRLIEYQHHDGKGYSTLRSVSCFYPFGNAD